MAILPAYPGLTVEIVVNDVPLQEYDDHKEELAPSKTITKYVEAQSGAEFTIRLTSVCPLPEPQFTTHIYLDGERVEKRGFKIGRFLLNEYHTIEGRLSKIGYQNVLQRFQFSEMTIIEGNTDRINKKLMGNLSSSGLIEIVLHSIGNVRRVYTACKPMDKPSIDVIPEKALKGQAKTHTATLVEAQETAGIEWLLADNVPGGPFAIFCFKYRLLAALQTLGIVLREPTPVPLEKRPEDQLSSEKLMQLVRRYKEKDAAALRIKKESTYKRNRYMSISGDSNATSDFEVIGTRNKKRRGGGASKVIVLD